MRIRTVRCHDTSDDLASVRLDEIELADPRPGEVQVRTKACAVHYPDLMMVRGTHQHRPPLPFTLGKRIRAAVSELANGGAINPHVCATFPLERTVDAMRMLENREVAGKCVITMNGYEIERA